MKKLYFLFLLFIQLAALEKIQAQDCSLLQATCTGYESRCASTGSIKINASGGSGSYKYRTFGPVNTNFTTTDSITGLSAGSYNIVVTDIVSNCSITITNVMVEGTYQDPRFTLLKQDVTCDNAANGSITVDGQLFGRSPFFYTIVAPSPAGIGTSNSTGVFTGLIAGDYSIRLTDSCGGIQTRQITIGNYAWWIDSYHFEKTGCDHATGSIRVVDSRGNISTVSGIPGFMYGIVRTPGDTLWQSTPEFDFDLNGHNNFEVLAMDACGIIKSVHVSVSLIPEVGANVNAYDFLCNTFTASMQNVRNFFNASFCLYDSSNTQINCNSSGVFAGLPYGSYCIRAHDGCTDTTITRCFSIQHPNISVDPDVFIFDKLCNTFSATITGHAGLTNPEYCLYNAANTQVECNTTGVFTMLPYEPYCITIHDGCIDTIITRCFVPVRPTPVFPAVIIPTYVTCRDFGIDVDGDTLTAPIYCLYDSAGVLIGCNSTGVFDNNPLGNYCVTIHDACLDTTVTRCFTVGPPTLTNNVILTVSNKACSTFTLTATTQRPGNFNYCLYNSSDSLIRCDSSGVFTNLPYGSYCVKVRVDCPDTTISACISASPLVPSVRSSVGISNSNCTTFTATIQQQTNLVNPNFCIYDNANVLIGCNGTGVFNNLPFGNYCIRITTQCYDTTIERCFYKGPPMISLTGTATQSCEIGYAKFQLSAGAAFFPVTVKIIRPNGTIQSIAAYLNGNINIDSIPAIPVGQFYTIIGSDACGNADTLQLGAPAAYFRHTTTVSPKCPGASWANGSGNLVSTVETNLGSLTVRIIKKDSVAYNPYLVPNSAISGVFTFTDLGPGVYIVSANENRCNKTFFDTITIRPYQFPNLSRSSAYQCDAGGFSVSAVASDGVAPFLYEIIGSLPSIPSINSGQQQSPLFNINNGSTYSLIRLRAIDACGNATLGDASILPMANTGIQSTTDCLFTETTLSVDSIHNSSYSWYWKAHPAANDSIFMGAGSSYHIPSVLPSDTGYYVCHLSINNGCINRTYQFHLSGLCYVVLPLKLESFSGETVHNSNMLSWKVSQETDIEQYVLESSNGNDRQFRAVTNMRPFSNGNSVNHYSYTEQHPKDGRNFYRLKISDRQGGVVYSNTVVLNNKTSGATVYPNPVTDRFSILFKAANPTRYQVSLSTITGQQLSSNTYEVAGGTALDIQRPVTIKPGIYLLRLVNLETNEVQVEKLIFR